MMKKVWIVPLLIVFLAFFSWFLSVKFLFSPYLTFSDAAKFADLARNLVSGNGFGASFAPFQKEFLGIGGLLPIGIPPFFPILIAVGFKIFGISDWMVLTVSGIFYLAGAITLFYLGKKVFGNLVGFFASLAFIFDPAMLNYATSGASESLFIFEIILATLLVANNTIVSLFLSFFILLLMYFTRPSAIIYIAGLTFFLLFLRFKKKDQILKAGGGVILIWLAIEAVLARFIDRFFLYSPLSSFLSGSKSFSPLVASTTLLRGGEATLVLGLKPFISKLFYNLYNFYKLLPNILSSYLAAFFFLSLFRWEKEREKRVFRGVALFMIAATFIASAAFLPIYRYLHPVIPFIYLLAIEMLVWIVQVIVKETRPFSLIKANKRRIFANERILTGVVATLLIIFFIGGQTMGKIFLDSRYLRAHTNQGKPPVYVKLSWILKESTNHNDLIVTNLDTWGSWYGERRTIWFPLEPSQLIPEEGKELKIDAIYLTSYKMDDENYFMGENWREIFYQREGSENSFLTENFELKGKFEIMPEETYEREGATAILLIKKND